MAAVAAMRKVAMRKVRPFAVSPWTGCRLTKIRM